VSAFARPLRRSTVGPQENPRVPFPGQKSGTLRFFLFRPKWTDGARADFWVYRRGFFQALAKKWVKIWNILEKSQKCRAKQNYFFVEPVPLHASFAHQPSCNTFFFEENCFLGESGEKYFLTPPATPATPGYPGFRVRFCLVSTGVENWSS
jgi:hypothetical protein